jgi:cyclopropane-fatty-acyl-phospholipid synthase
LTRRHRPRRNSLRGSRDNIHCHYDLGNDFYRLWLDERMVYTCAYFPTPQASLEEAQVAKLEHVCRKLALRPGERVIEAGCGWGALALHMARHHGVSVRAFNISHEQIAYARERAAREGLADRVEFIEDDYRNVSGHYDAFASIGMLEHVGRDHHADLGATIDRCLPPHGRGLLHSLGRNRPQAFNAWMERYIFPGAYIPALREMVEVLEPRNFSVLDVENLRLHYARTTEIWLQRFDQWTARVASMFDERFVRAWRLYLASSTASFLSGSIQLFQVVFARGENNDMPWTRAHLYEGQVRGSRFEV